MLRLTNGAEFLHIPKTGGIWVESVIRDNGHYDRVIGNRHADYDTNLFGATFNAKDAVWMASRRVEAMTRGNQPFGGRQPFRFCFVRNPITWYESWWKYMSGRGWNDWGAENSAEDWHPNAALNGLGSEDFNTFVANVVRKRPGYVSELLFSYTKPGISFIGRTEHLRDDLAAVLDTMGLAFDRDALFGGKRQNVSKTASSAVAWDPALKAVVRRLELPALVAFDYLTDDEKEALGVSEFTAPHPNLHRATTA